MIIKRYIYLFFWITKIYFLSASEGVNASTKEAEPSKEERLKDTIAKLSDESETSSSSTKRSKGPSNYPNSKTILLVSSAFLSALSYNTVTSSNIVMPSIKATYIYTPSPENVAPTPINTEKEIPVFSENEQNMSDSLPSAFEAENYSFSENEQSIRETTPSALERENPSFPQREQSMSNLPISTLEIKNPPFSENKQNMRDLPPSTLETKNYPFPQREQSMRDLPISTLEIKNPPFPQREQNISTLPPSTSETKNPPFPQNTAVPIIIITPPAQLEKPLVDKTREAPQNNRLSQPRQSHQSMQSIQSVQSSLTQTEDDTAGGPYTEIETKVPTAPPIPAEIKEDKAPTEVLSDINLLPRHDLLSDDNTYDGDNSEDPETENETPGSIRIKKFYNKSKKAAKSKLKKAKNKLMDYGSDIGDEIKRDMKEKKEKLKKKKIKNPFKSKNKENKAQQGEASVSQADVADSQIPNNNNNDDNGVSDHMQVDV